VRASRWPGVQVDIWHCDALGVYSDVRDRSFDTTGQKFLRGYQVTDDAGQARFTTIYPGWYGGRPCTSTSRSGVRERAGAPTSSRRSSISTTRLTDRVHAGAPYSRRKGSVCSTRAT
jgi:hypothetical protein